MVPDKTNFSQSSRVDILPWVPRPVSMLSATGTDAPSQSLFSRCRWDRPVPHPLLAVPLKHGNNIAAGGGYRAHLRAVTANDVSLIVGWSDTRNCRPSRAWNTTDTALFSHSEIHLHAETLQFRMHGSTEMCLLRVPRIRRVRGKRVRTPRRGRIPRHRRQIFSLQITASISLRFSAGSMTGQLSIGRLADISWILDTNH
ncbi:regulator of sigma E protease [Trypanosoma cruzi]|nr:regulator of sigma E protease [Trypanosoma cruzi]